MIQATTFEYSRSDLLAKDSPIKPIHRRSRARTIALANELNMDKIHPNGKSKDSFLAIRLRKATEIMLRDDLDILKTIIKTSSLTGENSQKMAIYFVETLNRNCYMNQKERFLATIIKDKLRRDFAFSKFPREILRDNSLATMIIISYVQSECEEYVHKALKPAFEKIASQISSCEIDPVKSNDDRLANTETLKWVCSIILHSILDAKQSLPPVVLKLCSTLKKEIEEIWTPTNNKSTSSSGNSRKGSESSHKRRSLIASLLPEHSPSVNPEVQSCVDSFSTAKISTNSDSLESYSKFTEQPEKRANILRRIKTQKLDANKQSVSNTSLLSSIDNVLGSLLFLRLFVPIISNPYHFGLVSERPTEAQRRGYLLAAKVLSALCNNIEFGTKELYMKPLNPFLRHYRPLVKSFLQSISSDPAMFLQHDDKRHASITRTKLYPVSKSFSKFFFRTYEKMEEDLSKYKNSVETTTLLSFQELKTLLSPPPCQNQVSLEDKSELDSQFSSKSKKSFFNNRISISQIFSSSIKKFFSKQK